ncbi:pyridoxal phosphate-dependent decarboxylase family protein [Nocardia terpenica]|uniref:Aminotransferase class V-fold PLP-dependent enzyme n=1 Tax=Nocardia terpenica TaxID=455432 RepID=A0A6G9Z7A7_9NOCA|nr:aminotransferase class V-fold PLP-dependent enzyme [Nocardia terpenica]QIS21398.1 aminotransferase class V-fold PLP-dependent enzyme [Nocardia terpenica]
MDLASWLPRSVTTHREWASRWPDFAAHPACAVDDERLGDAFAELAGRLRDTYPFFHPRYIGQMLKPPHPVAALGYLTAMLANPNNHALDGGPATAALEREVIEQLAAMFGLPVPFGHLTSSGTLGNLQALYVARESRPGAGVAFSTEAHYTHARMCHVLNIAAHPVTVDDRGRLDIQALEQTLRSNRVGTVVATVGTTALGAVDPVHEILPLARRYGVGVHVDAAYGGFHGLIAGNDAVNLNPGPWRAIGDCDSVVIDPHKHGLQPYGCGAVLYRDPEVGRFFLHDSPYTYFTSDRLHPGELSLECSRSGAAAAALWLTLRVFPLTPDGLGAVLTPGRQAALRWADELRDDPVLRLYQEPDLDIVTYYPARPRTTAELDIASADLMTAGMTAIDPVYVALLRVPVHDFALRNASIPANSADVRILRSVLMKPETLPATTELLTRLRELAQQTVWT